MSGTRKCLLVCQITSIYFKVLRCHQLSLGVIYMARLLKDMFTNKKDRFTNSVGDRHNGVEPIFTIILLR